MADLRRVKQQRKNAHDVCRRTSVGQVTETTVRTDRDGLSEEPGFNSMGRPVDFVFGFQGHMLRLISRAGKEGSMTSSIICDRWLILG